jgi:Fibronectin type III domain
MVQEETAHGTRTWGASVKRASQLLFTSFVALLTIFAIVALPETAGAAAVPGAPRAVTAVAAGSGAATVAWKAPASNGGSPILGYTVTPYLGVFAQTPVDIGGKATAATLTGLQDGKVYQFAVTARNAVGTGASSLRSVAMTVGVPLKPRAPTATWQLKPSQLQVLFLASNNGGAPIKSYTAKCVSKNGGKPNSATGPPKKFKTHYVIYVNGLTHDKLYNCRIKATNKWGSSVFSGGGPFRRA